MPCRSSSSLLLAALLLAAATVRAQNDRTPADPNDTPAAENAGDASTETPAAPLGEPIGSNDWLAAQVELTRRGFSCGSIDGVRGLQTVTTLKAWQKNEGLRETGELDRATLDVLLLTAPALGAYTFTATDLASTQPVPTTWLGKSQVSALYHNNPLELVAERCRANPKLLVKLNPKVKWDDLLPGATLVVPNAEPDLPPIRVSRVNVYLAEHVLQAVDDTGRIILHCPVSIAKNVEKRPVGELHITTVIPDPNYTFDPVNFPEVPEGKELGRRLIIPPGPNNPVGVAWIGLDRPGYGIHGTPDPEKVGRTESHGCFRLANWDARTLLRLVYVGMPVIVEE